MFSKKSRPARPGFRPSLEMLESRLAMAVPSITPFTDFDGNAGVRVIDGSASSELVIVDNAATDTQVLTLKRKNKPDIVRQGAFRVFDIDLGNGNDRVSYDTVGASFNNDLRQFHIDLGGGRNTLDFSGGNMINGSNIGLEIVGGKSNDFVDVRFDRVDESTLNILGRLGAGADGQLDAKNKVIGPSQVRVGDNDLIMNSSVEIDFDLGTGHNNFVAGINANLGQIAGLPASQVELNLVGSGRRGDVDKVTVDLTETLVGQAGVLAMHVDLLAGNDFFTCLVPGTFGLRNFDSASGGAVRLDVRGGDGHDNILVSRNGAGSSEIELDGLLTLLLSGGSGNDTIKVDFGAFGLFKTSVADAQDRGLRVRMDGDAGNDTLELLVSNDNSATFLYDLQVRGGVGNDKITFAAANIGGNPSFGPKIGLAGEVLLDGGLGTDLRKSLTVGGIPVLSVGFEGALP